ncbi:MAG: hypothetical protein JKX97_04725 [Candidatus Lindowbacteria bacterium]|nr:hypothetical protein [Candidatus Lindowbacteria bacterium]
MRIRGDKFGPKKRYKRSGQGLVEYGLVLGLVGVFVIACFLALGDVITDLMVGHESRSGEAQASLSEGIY